MEQTVLTASGLTMRYHSTLALDNLDLTLPQGKIVGLLGPNGSGKTTFIKLAAGLLTPTAGEITICGNKIGRPPRPWFPISLTAPISAVRFGWSSSWISFRIFTWTLTGRGQRKCSPR